VASYYLPLKPVWNRVLLTPEQYEKVFKQAGIKKSYQIVRDPARQNEYSYYTEMTASEILQNPDDFSKPNWFQINVHFDIVTHYDYLVLKYGDCSQPGKVPIVRIHSESLMNRFPLTDSEYSDRYKRSMDLIIRNGCGLILIFYNDGRGSGFGYYVLNVVKETLE
jgi:3,4-dihydroxy 2-butanone 4-phosphate synthase/GTP cyclohydrolase II